MEQIQRRKINQPKRAKSKTGIIVMTVACVMGLFMAVLPNFFLSRWIFGVFGVYVFALLFLTFFIGLSIHMRRKYTLSRRYVILSVKMLGSLFIALHIAFTSYQLGNMNFADYLRHPFEAITPGGVIFAVPAFVLNAIFFLEGALIVLGITFIIACAFLTTFVVTTMGENKVIKKLPTMIETLELQEEKSNKDISKLIEENYNELLRKQSERRHRENKSAIGLVPPKPIIEREVIKEATHDAPIPLNQLPPQPSVTDQINSWSTQAAMKFDEGISQSKDGLLPPLYTSLGPNYVTNIPQKQTLQPSNIEPQTPNNINPYDALYGQIPPQHFVAPSIDFGTTNTYQNGFNAPQPQMSPYISERTTPIPPPAVDFSPPTPEIRINNDRMNFGQTEMNTDAAKKPKVYKRAKYNKPSAELIRTESTNLIESQKEAVVRQHLLDAKLKEFGVNAKVTSFTVAPAVTRFEIQLATGTRVAHVTQLENDIAYALGSPSIRIESTIEGKNAIGVEVPNKTVGKVSIKDILNTQEFMQHKSQLAVVIGKDLNDAPVVADITQMPHLLIAGSTGSGKSVCLNTILTSLLFRAHPDDVKLLLVDMKRVELNMYNDIPHMLIPKALKEVNHVINALKWMASEMTRRYDILESHSVQNIAHYQSLPAYQSGTLERMPYILMVIDEAADLLSKGKKEVEDAIKSLAALARACGIHIILATQRPSVDVITGVIKANFPVRIAFKVGSRGDSGTIINESGAEKLVGRGDMLFVQDSYMKRIQGAFIEAEESRKVMNFIRENNAANFDTDLEDIIINGPPVESAASGFGDAEHIRKAGTSDPAFIPIVKWMVREDNLSRTVSISNMQRMFSLGFSRAGKIMDAMEAMGYVAANNGSKARDVLATRDEIERLYGE
ncbi:MAG: DNA translocase FtsK [Firmicutes bacterium]|nr:DNA translocase FtsK [Bacillota bacterium]